MEAQIERDEAEVKALAGFGLKQGTATVLENERGDNVIAY